MKMTSAQAAKLLRQWNESLKALQRREENTKTFLASLGEDLESVRPEYDYAAMQAEQAAIEANRYTCVGASDRDLPFRFLQGNILRYGLFLLIPCFG